MKILVLFKEKKIISGTGSCNIMRAVLNNSYIWQKLAYYVLVNPWLAYLRIWLLWNIISCICSHKFEKYVLICLCKFWQGLPLPDDSSVVSLAAAIGTLWILTDNGKIYIRQGVTDQCPDGKSWKELSLAQLGKCNVIYSWEEYVC
jgi:hypothetical protein